jgi:hypothetical protein
LLLDATNTCKPVLLPFTITVCDQET